MEKILFTSESVSEGHPDKVCDQISDAVLDAYLVSDSMSRVACETFVTTERVIVAGEVSTNAIIDVESIVRNKLKDIGYTHKDLGIGYDTCKVEVIIHEQSSDIAMGVESLGAGDQGIMFGYATNETKGLMPLAIVISHKLVRVATNLRKSGDFKWARPDMKSQVTIDYSKDFPKVDTIVMSVQHDEDFIENDFKDYINQKIIKPVLESFEVDFSEYNVLINPTGRFVIGGPHGDTGLTGRKIIVDTYGGASRHGGGAFSGKDATKVDRSAAYACRYIAKNIVAAGLSDRCEIQLSYAIGVNEPTSIMIETFGTAKVENDIIIKAIRENFDLTPKGIINKLDLRKPIYSETAAYGHMGRSQFTWEKLDMVEKFSKYL